MIKNKLVSALEGIYLIYTTYTCVAYHTNCTSMPEIAFSVVNTHHDNLYFDRETIEPLVQY